MSHPRRRNTPRPGVVHFCTHALQRIPRTAQRVSGRVNHVALGPAPLCATFDPLRDVSSLRCDDPPSRSGLARHIIHHSIRRFSSATRRPHCRRAPPRAARAGTGGDIGDAAGDSRGGASRLRGHTPTPHRARTPASTGGIPQAGRECEPPVRFLPGSSRHHPRGESVFAITEPFSEHRGAVTWLDGGAHPRRAPSQPEEGRFPLRNCLPAIW